MSSSVAELQERAVEYAKSANFGPDAIAINVQITDLAPSNEGAWTRLARCYLETGRLDDASTALETVLKLNPQNTIARNLHMEVTKRRAAAAPAEPRPRARGQTRSERPVALSAFGRPEFAALGHLQPATAVEVLGPRVEALLLALNERPFAAAAVETRNRAGRPGARLFRRNSFYPGSAGHIFAFQHGGRWEPQLNVGWFAAATWGRDAVRAGIGFNLTQEGRDPEGEAGSEQAAASFAHFQQLASTTWRQLLIDWMSVNAGFLQYGVSRPPDTSVMPAAAIGWIGNCRNPADVGWIFLGRWLFADRTGDAETLGDMRKLTAWIERTFTDLLPLWSEMYRR